MKPQIKVAFLSGTGELNGSLIARMREIFPHLPLHVVSDFPPEDPSLPWVRYSVNRGFRENLARCRAAFAGVSIRLSAVMLVPNVPFRRMRLLAFVLAPAQFLAFNENLNNFMLRPGSVPAILRHVAWRVRNLLRWAIRGSREADWPLWFAYTRARLAGWLRPRRQAVPAPLAAPLPTGISVIVPSRNGRDLLAVCLPRITGASEIIVVDNGSTDGTAAYLEESWPAVRIEVSPAPLSFARAVNRGLARARFSHVCLLNNDMAVAPGFLTALASAFSHVTDLFCATAQIVFPAGQRREETGKTVMRPEQPEDFPVRCDEPLAGEDLSYVLYGSGGCSLYDGARLAALGGVDEAYEPAYVEDLDLGWRAWQRGWPSVYVARAVVEHRHRATTSRYYTPEQLDRILEVNYLRFLARAVASPPLFRRLWGQAARRLYLRESRSALAAAPQLALDGGSVVNSPSEEQFVALNSGAVAVFPGRAPSGKPRVLVASPYVPFPLSHGGAVRIYNLMREAAVDYDQVLIAFTEKLAPPAPELLAICSQIVLVHRAGSHSLPATGRPDVVEEFASLAFRAALLQTMRQWQPSLAQLEFTQMAQYAPDCAPARTILVEHDVTFDLYQQLLALGENWEYRQQLALWRRFETAAWLDVDRVVVMSGKDRALIPGSRAVTIPNGVDLERFRPSAHPPDSRRLLFIGSFAHRPNVLAMEFFLSQVFPRLTNVTLHVIAGKPVDLQHPGVEVEGFVSDVRPAYERATLVIAPLTASAGTNIKILEAMAMGKAVVATAAGVNGLDLRPGQDFILAESAEDMACAIESLLANEDTRRAIEAAARRCVEHDFGWNVIARRQSHLYRSLCTGAE